MSLTQIFSSLNLFFLVSHETLIILQRAARKIHLRAYQCICYNYKKLAQKCYNSTSLSLFWPKSSNLISKSSKYWNLEILKFVTDIFKVKIGFSLSTWIVFSNLSKTILLVNKFAVQAIGCKGQGKNNGSVCKNNNLGSRKLSLRVMQNMYSPNRFYVTFPHDDSWNFVKIWDLIKKFNTYIFIQT